MIGLLIALLIAIGTLVYGNIWAVAYSNATAFLFFWYIAWSFVLAGILLLVTFGVITAQASPTFTQKALGMSWLLLLLQRGCLVVGMLLLHNAVSQAAGAEPMWNVGLIVLGTIVWLVGCLKISFSSD